MIVRYRPSNHHRALITMKFRRRPASAGRQDSLAQQNPGGSAPQKPIQSRAVSRIKPHLLPLTTSHALVICRCFQCMSAPSTSIVVSLLPARARAQSRNKQSGLSFAFSGTMCVQRQAGGRVVEPPRPYGRVSAPRGCARSCLASLHRQRQRARASGVSPRSEATVPTRPSDRGARFAAGRRIPAPIARPEPALYSAWTYVPVIRRHAIPTTTYSIDHGRSRSCVGGILLPARHGDLALCLSGRRCFPPRAHAPPATWIDECLALSCLT
jgi:hypothetical protein